MNKECDQKLNNAFKGLSKIATPITDDETNTQSTFRDGLMEDILKDNPGLTYEKLDRQMSEFGF